MVLCIVCAFNVIAGASGVQLNELQKRFQVSLYVRLHAKECSSVSDCIHLLAVLLGGFLRIM